MATYQKNVALKLVKKILSTIASCRISIRDWCFILIILFMEKAARKRTPEARIVMYNPGHESHEESCSIIG